MSTLKGLTLMCSLSPFHQTSILYNLTFETLWQSRINLGGRSMKSILPPLTSQSLSVC